MFHKKAETMSFLGDLLWNAFTVSRKLRTLSWVLSLKFQPYSSQEFSCHKFSFGEFSSVPFTEKARGGFAMDNLNQMPFKTIDFFATGAGLFFRDLSNGQKGEGILYRRNESLRFDTLV